MHTETIPNPPSSGITLRSFLVGLLLAFFISIATPYSVNAIHGSTMALDFSTPAAIFLFFILAGIVNVILRSIKRSFGFGPQELIVVYIMMIVACAISTMGLTCYLLPIMVTPYYYASPENRWAELLHPYIPRWIAPYDPEVIRRFFEGSPKGESIPWEAWAGPLIFWGAFLTTLYFVMICTMVILRKQWVERERLVFPLAHLPQEMIQEGEKPAIVSPFFKNKLMWIGFAIPFIIGSMNGLHHYIHLVPNIPQVKYLSVFRRMQTIVFRVSFPMIGFSYLLNLDVAFSLWFFNLLTTTERGIFNILGMEGGEFLDPYSQHGGGPLLSHQSMGAMMVLVILGLWIERRHLRDVFKKAMTKASEIDDSEEILSYRTAFWGTILGLAFMTLWLTRSGLPLWAAILFLAASFLIFIGITRIVSEGGVAETRAPLIASTFVVSGFGSTALGPAGLLSFGYTYTWMADVRTFVMVSCANALMLAEGIKGKKRMLFWVIMAAVVVSMAGSVWMTLKLGYTSGGANANHWFFVTGAQCPFHFAANRINNPTPPNWTGWLFTGIGAAAMILVTFVHYRFVWWPLHPIGLPVSTVMLTNQIWFSIFLAWLIKLFVLKLGGMELYNKSRFLFLGLILGQFTCSGMWLTIDFIAGTTGNSLFWI